MHSHFYGGHFRECVLRGGFATGYKNGGGKSLFSRCLFSSALLHSPPVDVCLIIFKQEEEEEEETTVYGFLLFLVVVGGGGSGSGSGPINANIEFPAGASPPGRSR